MKAVFLGAVPEETVPDLCCRFLANRAVKCMRVSSAGDFLLQNTLQIGRAYELDVADGLVTAVRACEILPTPPASPSGAIPGLRTLKNLLAAAMFFPKTNPLFKSPAS